MRKCILCNSVLPEEALIKLKNMPSMAQYMPDADNLDADKPIILEVVECKNCSLVQLTNEVVPYYKEVIRASGVSKEMHDFRMEQFNYFLDKFNLHEKRIVEIACGNGDYLKIMKELNRNTYGLEFNKEYVKKLNEIDIETYHGYIDSSDYRISDVLYDGFFVLNYLEHCPNPRVFLEGIRNNLTDGAYGIIEVPNFDMIISENLFSEFISDHLAYYNESNLRLLLSISGFEVVSVEKIWDEYILSAVVKSRSKIDVESFHKTHNSLVSDITGYISKWNYGELAIWGAGHQALTLMALSDLKGKVKYVIDSAKFKQGKYTQVTHIPIVSPEILKNGDIKSVLIIAAGYSNEIAEIIRQNYSNVSIAIVDKTKIKEINNN